MSFKSSKFNSVDGYLRDLQQNVFMPIHTVHDEIDYIMDDYILSGLMKRLSELAACKNVFDKLGTGFVDYLCDCEFDRKGLSWLPSDNFPIYQCPSCDSESEAMKRWNSVKDRKNEIETLELEVSMDKAKTFKSSNISTSGDDLVSVVLVVNGDRYKSSKLFSKKDLLLWYNS